MGATGGVAERIVTARVLDANSAIRGSVSRFWKVPRRRSLNAAGACGLCGLRFPEILMRILLVAF
jgi:hypothetical protein